MQPTAPGSACTTRRPASISSGSFTVTRGHLARASSAAAAAPAPYLAGKVRQHVERCTPRPSRTPEPSSRWPCAAHERQRLRIIDARRPTEQLPSSASRKYGYPYVRKNGLRIRTAGVEAVATKKSRVLLVERQLRRRGRRHRPGVMPFAAKASRCGASRCSSVSMSGTTIRRPRARGSSSRTVVLRRRPRGTSTPRPPRGRPRRFRRSATSTRPATPQPRAPPGTPSPAPRVARRW